jgi:hypothetical protein
MIRFASGTQSNFTPYGDIVHGMMEMWNIEYELRMMEGY